MIRAMVIALLTGALAAPICVRAGPALELVSTIPLPGVKGRIDHFSMDVKGHRLFVAALGNDTVEVVDTNGDDRRTIRGLGEPQGVLYVPGSNRLFIANGSAGRLDIVDATSLQVIKRVGDIADADNVRFDADAGQVVVGYGRGALRFIDPDTGGLAGEIGLPGHPESFQLERGRRRAYVNVPTAHAVVVIDRERRTTAARWGTAGMSQNFPMALDEASHRLFVGTRMPAALLVFDTESGKVVAKVPIGGDTDDVFFDAERRRLYVICGEGRVDVVRQESPDRYVVEESIKTAARARTGLYVPAQSRLYIGAPADGPTPARLLVFRAQ